MKFAELAIGDPVVVTDAPDATVFTVRALDEENGLVALQYVTERGLPVRGGWMDPSLVRRAPTERVAA
jgi:hypothetical protein